MHVDVVKLINLKFHKSGAVMIKNGKKQSTDSSRQADKEFVPYQLPVLLNIYLIAYKSYLSS